MTERDTLSQRGRSQEEDWFRKRELERLAALARVDEEARARRELAQAIGSDDPELLDTLTRFGLDRHTMTRVFAIPLVQMAWMDGQVSRSERLLVLELAAARGIEAGSPLHEQLGRWLAERPDEGFFERSLGMVRALARALPPAQANAALHALIADCQAIARASGGLFGIRAVTADEQALIGRLEDEMSAAAAA